MRLIHVVSACWMLVSASRASLYITSTGVILCVLSWKDVNSLCSHILYSILSVCGGLIEQSFSLWPWHHPEVCVWLSLVCECVYKHPGLFVRQSGCWQRCLILGRWITASCGPAEAVDADQRVRERQRDLNKQEEERGKERKTDSQREMERETPQREETGVRRKIDRHRRSWRDKESEKCLGFSAHGSISTVLSAVYSICTGIYKFTPSTSTSSSSSSFTLRI